MENQIKNMLLPAFDVSDRTFDEEKILARMRTTLRKISIPNLTADESKYYTMLDEKMTGHASNGAVKNDDIPFMKQVQGDILREVEKDMKANLRAQGADLQSKLYEQGGTFIDGIVNDLEANAKRMETLIRNKEANLARYEAFLIRLQDAKKLLRENKA